MADVVEKTTVTDSTPAGNVVRQTTTTRGGAGDFFVSKTNQLIFSIVAIIDVLILLRFLFLLLGANRVGIVDFIIGLTNVFVAPFVGIFPAPTAGGAYFDTASVVAIVIYLILGYILSLLISLFSTRDTTVV